MCQLDRSISLLLVGQAAAAGDAERQVFIGLWPQDTVLGQPMLYGPSGERTFDSIRLAMSPKEARDGIPNRRNCDDMLPASTASITWCYSTYVGGLAYHSVKEYGLRLVIHGAPSP